MSKEQKITNNIKVPNKDLETLRINFPHCFDKDGNFQLEKFKNNLTEKEINFSTESYGLDWLGKSYARLLASDPATTLLKADETHNSKPENANSENLLIKGDNLEVLKHLANAYYEQVKMIYIDPPYNTGSDGFVYNDDRKFTAKELQQLIGVDAEKAKRILDFIQSKSNSHSAWLTFMYPRLYIAKQLLKDDGVIFVSIDDNEVAQLRLLMDEVFGEENFLANIIWEKRFTRSNSSKTFATLTEHILCFRKSEYLTEIKELRNEKANSTYSNPDNDERGVWTSVSYVGPTTIDQRPNLHYKLSNPITGEDVIHPAKPWKYERSTYLKHVEENRLYWGKDGANTYPRLKRFLSEMGDEMVPVNFWNRNEGGTTDEASKYLEQLFKEKVFDFSKPTTLLKKAMKIASNNSDIILDFFAGSGTTGDAVMQLNTEDGGNRKFILVQLPESIDPKKNKTAYDFVKNDLKAEPTIFEITKERLLLVAKKINAELDEKNKNLKLKIKNFESELQTEETKQEIKNLQEQITQNSKLKTQNCFKIYETTPIWEDYNFEAEEFDSSQTLFDTGKLKDEDIKALLITWKTYDGIALTQELEIVDLSGYTAFYGSGKLYLLHKNFTIENLKAVLEKIDSDKTFNPTSIIAFGYHFESKSLRELSENVKQYANKKKIDIDFITRY